MDAQSDVNEAYLWYESRRIGLGLEFLTAIDACFIAVSRNPSMYQVIYKEYRRAVIRRFPYAAFYEETTSEILIYGLFDCRENPKKWQERLQ